MKRTDINNPEINNRDERIIELNRIVRIANMFEEDPDLIQKIYDALDQYDAVQDWHKILEIVYPT